jgi:hypothetical protein
MTFDLRNKEFKDHLIRRKVDWASPDPVEWAWLDNNSFTVTFGGVATDGNYVVNIVPVAANVDTTNLTVTTVRAGGVPATNADLATQHVIDAQALLDAAPTTPLKREKELSTYIQSVSASSDVVTYIVQPGAPAFTVTTTPPAPATLDRVPDDRFPITYDTLGFAEKHRARTDLDITVIPVDIDSVPLNPAGATTNITVNRMIDRVIPQNNQPPSTPVGVSGSVTEAAHPVGKSFRIKGGGGRFGMSLGALVGAIPGVVALEVWAREVNQ